MNEKKNHLTAGSVLASVLKDEEKKITNERKINASLVFSRADRAKKNLLEQVCHK